MESPRYDLTATPLRPEVRRVSIESAQPWLKLSDHGRPSAAAAARAEMLELFSEMAPASQYRLLAARVVLHTLPRDTALTDLREFAALAHDASASADGVPWAEVRALTRRADGLRRVHVAVDECHVLDEPPNQNFSRYNLLPGYAITHEFAHVLMMAGVLAPDRLERLNHLFASCQARGGPWLDDYSQSNVDEYWAQGCSAFWNRPGSDADRITLTPARLRTRDPDLYAMITAVFPERAAAIDVAWTRGRTAPPEIR